MANPSPTPLCVLVADGSAWVKESNNNARCPGAMPIPVSVTASSIPTSPASALIRR